MIKNIINSFKNIFILRYKKMNIYSIPASHLYMADFIAVRIEDDMTYKIIKSRKPNINGTIISNDRFKEVLSNTIRPIVLSDKCIDID